MGRNPKNRFTEVSLAFKDDFKIIEYDVEIPFVYKLRILPPNEDTGYYEEEYYVKPPVNVIMLVDEIEKKGWKIIHSEPAVRRFSDLCPRCKRQGIPKIEKKDASDRRVRSAKDRGILDFTIKERPSELWLTYTHSSTEKCRICQYVNTPYPAYKQNDIDIEKYFFPHILEHMKKGSVQYADQSQ